MFDVLNKGLRRKEGSVGKETHARFPNATPSSRGSLGFKRWQRPVILLGLLGLIAFFCIRHIVRSTCFLRELDLRGECREERMVFWTDDVNNVDEVVADKTEDFAVAQTESISEATVIATTQPIEIEEGKVQFIACDTSVGTFVLKINRTASPITAARLVSMVRDGFYNSTIPFFRVNGAMAQFGAFRLKDEEGNTLWPQFRTDEANVMDENPHGGIGTDDVSVAARKAHPWPRGTFSLIGNTQSVVVIKANEQMGVNTHDSIAAVVIKGMDTVFDRLYRYNDIINNPNGEPGPDQRKVMQAGMKYIEAEFPLTDYIIGCVAY